MKEDTVVDLHTLQEELKKLGISVVSGRQNTVISVKIKGLAGKALLRGLRLADQLLQEKIKQTIKACTDPTTKLFTDPTFGPSSSDPDGAAAICKAGGVIPSKGGSQHQAKVLGLLQRGKIRWERPLYAADDEGDDDSSQEGDESNDNDIYAMSSSQDNVFATKATLFADGVSSGDVIQGNLGDCWFLSALSVVATRSDLLEQIFWRGDQHKTKGLFVCKFMKNFVWNYVIVDDCLPVFGFTDKKSGKPYFARCRNSNELWVSIIEKAYAKLHGSYEALIGGFVDCALNDLTGMCSEQVILKEGYPGFGENPYAPAKPQQKIGDPLWEKITRYKQTGTLMGCSIQPPVTSSKDVAAESSAGNGLFFKHAYALVDAAEIKPTKGESVRLVKLRNPWGMGEWTGPWSDSSEERAGNQDAIEQYFMIMKRTVGANADKRMFMTLNAKGKVGAAEISQEEVVDINANDGTFFMSFDAWMKSFTHFFAGIDFPDSWHGRRSEGSWNETNNGGNTTKTTWINNPHFELVLEQRARIFASLSQEDPRGTENLKIVPVGFHICSLSPVGNETSKLEMREPPKKIDAYYRLYKPADRDSFQTGKRPEHLPPAIIPGSVIPGIDDDGVPQPAYTFKQAVSVEATIEPGKYCIIPSMYMRMDKATGHTNVGSFWISVYSDKPSFRLEGGEKIVEEEEGDDENLAIESNGRKISTNLPGDRSSSTSTLAKSSTTILSTGSAIAAEKRRRYENEKEELLRQAKRYGIGLRELRTEFAKTTKIQKIDCRHRLQKLGFSLESWDDETIGLIFGGLEDGPVSGVIYTETIIKLFTPDTQEEKMACELPDLEEDDDSSGDIHREGTLEIELHGANGLAVCDKRQLLIQRKIQIQAPEFSNSHSALRRRIACEILDEDVAMAWQLRYFARKSILLVKSRFSVPDKKNEVAIRSILPTTTPIQKFYNLLEKEFTARLQSSTSFDQAEVITPVVRTPVYSKRDTVSPFFSALSPKGAPGFTSNEISSDAVDLHRSNRIRELEAKRSSKLSQLLQHKQRALGDAEKTAALPRLIGGRKSGSSYVKCIDCGKRVLLGGRGNQVPGDADSYPCNGSNCVNVLCRSCFILLPVKSKLCEECFQHEVSPEEKLGEQLRVVLIEKIGASEQQRAHLEEVFRSFDVDGSGSLSLQEFEKMLQRLDIRPALTEGQNIFLVDQFDTNGDGEISLTEFKHWILKDRVWEETAAPVASSEDRLQNAGEFFNTVIAPICDDILNLAYDAYEFSSSVQAWSHSISSTSASEGQNRGQQTDVTGAVIFQRVVSLTLGSSMGTSAADKVFELVDGDGSGQIDRFEFMELLITLGICLDSNDAKLLMSGLGATRNSSGTSTITRSAFMRYVEQITAKQFTRLKVDKRQSSLPDILILLDTYAENGPHTREAMQGELQRLHENISRKDIMILRKSLEEKTGLVIEVNELECLSKNLSFHEDRALPEVTASIESSTQLATYKSSGDILTRLILAESSDLMKLVKSFDTLTLCGKLATHLQTLSGTNSTVSIWRSVFGVDTVDVIHLHDFLDGVVETGFFAVSRAEGVNQVSAHQLDRLTTKLLLSLVVDAVRLECEELQDASDVVVSGVSFNLFTLVMQLQHLKDIERKFDHALKHLLQLRQGEQTHLVTVALGYNRDLIIRARDPVFKYVADFVLHENEYDCKNLLAQFGDSRFESRLQEAQNTPWELAFTKAPQGLITAEFYPELNAVLITILSRLRVEYRHHNTSTSSNRLRLSTLYISLVESESFVTALRGLFLQVELPFFWSVSPRTLVLSIDNEYLEQQNKPSFQQIVAETLSNHGASSSSSLRALKTFISHTASSLLVRYEVIGEHTNVETSWQEFQDFIAGHQDTYAVMELHPQGELFTTRVARTSESGAVQWNFKRQIFIKEPKVCDLRIDRPVIFTDTVKISCIPGRTPMSKNISFIVDESGENPGHFVVVSVRRALPSGPNSSSPRLYCTAYDPLTSCDYAVEGYPSNWSVDFFEVTTNPMLESQWHAMLSTMHLGETLTPKLVVSVFNKQPKTDKLIGECEVSVGSSITMEGHIFEERVALQSPHLSSSAGVAFVTFRFDVKRTKATLVDVERSNKTQAHHSTGTSIPIQLGAQYLAGEIETPRTEVNKENNADIDSDNVQQLQASIVSIEQAKLEAQEQVRQLKAQVQQLSSVSSRASEDAAERWKRRLDQARQEQFVAEEDHAKRLAALRDELRLQREENEKQRTAPREATNLKDCRLSPYASAHDILSAMRGILMSRCAERPYNGLKKALATEAEVPGKVTFAVLNNVLTDFGLALSTDHRSTLSAIIDLDIAGRVSLEDFFIKLCGDAEAYAMIKTPRSRPPTPEPSSPAAIEEPSEPVVFTPSPPTVQRPLSPVASPVRASVPRPKMAWQDMKKFLVLNLPEGWETRFTEKGRPYFCNHADRSTQWKHPRAEIETIFNEWIQENGAYFNRRSTSARISKQKQ